MKPIVPSLPLALLFLASVVPTFGQTTTTEAAAPAAAVGLLEEGAELVLYESRTNFTLDCREAAGAGGAVTWTKNGTELSQWEQLKGHVQTLGADNAQLSLVQRASEWDAGNYTCRRGGEVLRGFDVRTRVVARLHDDTNVVEGQPLKLSCRLVGRPYPAVLWTYSASDDHVVNGSDVRALFAERVSLAPGPQGAPDAELTLAPAERADEGWFRCAPLSANSTAAITRVRVKDKFAALWPFLGICAEVFVLCAIILIYEKRRTKPELDDSDTDNHDQKKS